MPDPDPYEGLVLQPRNYRIGRHPETGALYRIHPMGVTKARAAGWEILDTAGSIYVTPDQSCLQERWWALPAWDGRSDEAPMPHTPKPLDATDLGGYFVDYRGQLWKMVSYDESPSAGFERVLPPPPPDPEGPSRLFVGTGSRMFTRLVRECRPEEVR